MAGANPNSKLVSSLVRGEGGNPSKPQTSLGFGGGRGGNNLLFSPEPQTSLSFFLGEKEGGGRERGDYLPKPKPLSFQTGVGGSMCRRRVSVSENDVEHSLLHLQFSFGAQ